MRMIGGRLDQALEATGKRYTVNDPSLPGFQIRVGATGTASASVFYRKGGRLRRFTLGKLNDAYTLTQARQDAAAVLVAVRAGRDPAADRKATKGAPTFGVVALRFITEHAEKWPAARIRRAKLSLKMHVLPAIGSLWAHEVVRSDIERMVQGIGGAGDARAAIDLCSSIMVKAEEWGYRPARSNPCPGAVARVTEEVRKLSKSDFQDKLDAAMAKMNEGHGGRPALLSTWLDRLMESFLTVGTKAD